MEGALEAKQERFEREVFEILEMTQRQLAWLCVEPLSLQAHMIKRHTQCTPSHHGIKTITRKIAGLAPGWRPSHPFALLDLASRDIRSTTQHNHHLLVIVWQQLHVPNS